MSPETFLEKFDLIADAPGAVAKMKELVLNLAVQGRLVSNDTENHLCFEALQTTKNKRLAELRIRSHPETTPTSPKDFPFVLPDYWCAVTLGDVAFSCPTSYGEDPVPSLVKAGVVKVGNIDNQGGFKGQFVERGFTPSEIDTLLARRGDLMVVKSSGSAENVHSGKTALCTQEHDGKIVGSNFVLRLRLIGPEVLPEYIWRVLTSRYCRNWIEGTVQTMTYPNLKWSDFARFPIPIPPLAEQKRIVAKVDELMALCDRLEQQQNEREAQHAALSRASLTRFSEAPTPENLEYLFHPTYTTTPADLRKTILTLAVQGKLVPQVSTEIIDREFIDELTPEDLPPSWRYLNFGKWCDIQGGNQPPKSQFIDKPKDGYVRLLQIRDLGDKEVPTYIPINSTNRFCKEGELMIGRYGASVGKIFWAKEGAYNVALAKFIYPPKAYLARFAFLALQSDFFQCKMVGASRSAQAGFNKGDLADINLPLPPLAEQNRIVAKVDELMKLVDQLEAQLSTARTTAENLLNALLADLTSQKAA